MAVHCLVSESSSRFLNACGFEFLIKTIIPHTGGWEYQVIALGPNANYQLPEESNQRKTTIFIQKIHKRDEDTLKAGLVTFLG